MAKASANKVFWSELDVHMHDTALALLGPRAQLLGGASEAVAAGRWLDGWMFSLAGPIYAGTNEIQRDVIADRVLGLPRSRCMHVGLDADQHALRDAAAAMLAATCTTAHVRAAYLAPPDASRERWRQLASVGLTSITTPVELGGVGRDDVDLAVLMEEAGYVALPEPLSAAATAAALLAEVAPEVAARLLPELASGDLMLALTLPGEPFVEHADAADLFVTADGDAVFVLEPGDVRIERVRPRRGGVSPVDPGYGCVSTGAPLIFRPQARDAGLHPHCRWCYVMIP